VALLIGFAVNDSGTSIPPVAVAVLAPLLVAICARVVQLDDVDRDQAVLTAALRPVKPRPRTGR
jgi:hypothetical protein